MSLSLNYRDFQERYIRDPRLGHRLGRNYPEGVDSDSTFGFSWLGTNSNGFYGQNQNFSIEKCHKYRIMILGGSAAMGLGATRREKLFSNLLLENLQSQTNSLHKFEVLNCAVGDYSSSQSLLAFQGELIQFAPDMIVIVDGFNDFSHSTWGSKFAGGAWLENTTRSFDDCLFALKKWEHPFCKEVLKYQWQMSSVGKMIKGASSRIRRKSRTSLSGDRGGLWDDPSKWSIKDEAINWYFRNLYSFAGIAAAHNIKIAHFFQPCFLWTGKRKLTTSESLNLEIFRSKMPELINLAPKYYEKVKVRYRRAQLDLESRFPAGSISLFDFGELFDFDEFSAFADPIHYSDYGQEKLAKLVHEAISDHIQL